MPSALAFSHSARPSAFAARFAELGILAGPAQRIAQRRDLGLPRRRTRGPREVHPHRAFVLARERVALRREVDVARGLGGDRGAVVGGEHPAEEAHARSIAAQASGGTPRRHHR